MIAARHFRGRPGRAAAGLWFALAAAAAAETIEIRAVEGLRFDVRRARLTPGTSVTLQFQNADATDQPHNLLIVRPGRLRDAVDAALALGVDGPARDFIPGGDLVLAASRLLKAGEREDLVFRVPAEPAIYPFVCTFPGHGALMFGAFYAGVPMPPEADDPNIPKAVAAADAALAPDPRPMVRRVFLPDAGPAAIAVALPGDQNFCWDAGECRLRYAWKGGFLDADRHFTTKGQPTATPLGAKWLQTAPGFPLALDGRPPSRVRFRGYSRHAGIPTFEYDIDGQPVRETISPDDAGGLRVRFELPGVTKPLTAHPGAPAGAAVESPAGRLVEGRLTLTAAEARRFELVFRPIP
jgi:azurin